MMITTIGLDLAKNTVQVHGIDAAGRPVLRKKLARDKVLAFFANLPRSVIGAEAGAGAHHWARELAKLGHTVRLMPPQYVRPYVKTNKHDVADAEGCCEAVQRPGMRFVPVKSTDQQSLLMLHRVRDQLLGQRTATINALRGHLAEFGIAAAQRRRGLGELLAIVADTEDDRLPLLARELLAMLADQLRALDDRVKELDRRLVQLARTDMLCRRLAEVPGIGPVVATALAATVADARLFRSGRHFAAWLGPSAAFHRRQGTPAGDQQTWRRLPAAAADQRRPRLGTCRSGSRGNAVELGQCPAGPTAVQRRGGGGGQQAGADLLGADGPQRELASGLSSPARPQESPRLTGSWSGGWADRFNFHGAARAIKDVMA
jgi:transposase